MLVARIELWPGGNDQRAREIARVGIWNESECLDVSDYGYSSQEDPSIVTTSRTDVRGRIFGFPRRELGAIDLLYRVLLDAVGGRNHEGDQT